jgi:hypothetical protein
LPDSSKTPAGSPKIDTGAERDAAGLTLRAALCAPCRPSKIRRHREEICRPRPNRRRAPFLYPRALCGSLRPPRFEFLWTPRRNCGLMLGHANAGSLRLHASTGKPPEEPVLALDSERGRCRLPCRPRLLGLYHGGIGIAGFSRPRRASRHRLPGVCPVSFRGRWGPRTQPLRSSGHSRLLLAGFRGVDGISLEFTRYGSCEAHHRRAASLESPRDVDRLGMETRIRTGRSATSAQRNILG